MLPRVGSDMTLQRFLSRLILLCVLPLLLLAVYLAVESVRDIQSELDVKAANFADDFATQIDQELNARIGALLPIGNWGITKVGRYGV
jgi:hypothetical protein